MKKHFKKTRLSELGEITRGVTYKSPDDLRPAGSPRTVQLLRATNIQDGAITLDDVQVIDEACAPERQRLATGDIAICIANGSRALVGKAALVDIGEPDGYVVGAFCARYRPRPGESSDLIAAIFESQEYRSWIDRLLGTTTINNLKPSDIANCPIMLPTEERGRRRLGAVMRTNRNAIRHTDALIAAKREQKRGLMQQLLTGKVRFPGFTEPWKTVRLADVLSEDRTPGSTGASARKITVKLYGKGVIAKVEKRAGSESTRYFRRRAGQLIYSKLDCLNGAFGIIPEQLEGYESTLDMPAFDIRPSANPDWLLAVVSRPSFYTRFKDGADGSRKAQRVDPTRFLEELIQLPSRHEQDRIAALLLCAEREIILLASQRHAMAAQRRGLMERLLSGEIDIPSSDTSAA